MDLKNLLLHSISSRKTLRYSKRVIIGKECYAIAYEVKGKILRVKKIKQIFTKLPLHTRLRKRERGISLCCKAKRKAKAPPVPSLPILETESEPFVLKSSVPPFKDNATQTLIIKRRSRGTDIEKHTFMVTRDQQTNRKVTRKQITQTESLIVNQGIQTERRAASRFCQTEWCYIQSMASQTQIDTSNNQVQTENIDERPEKVHAEKEAVVFLLNEIGEMIINQNHLLHNNSTLLGQISEMTMLSKVVSRQNYAMKYCKKARNSRSNSMRYARRSGKNRCVFVFKKRRKTDIRHQSVQTLFLVDVCHKATQTLNKSKIKRRRRFLCCCC